MEDRLCIPGFHSPRTLVIACSTCIDALNHRHCADLRKHLGEVPDPRARRGIRYPWTAMLTALTAAVLSGAASITTIGEWSPPRPPPFWPCSGSTPTR
ncbi:transposase family protein [Streptomyces sp. NPDC014882]|uniref:transposase family protein n=1 Tax=Streptomyces sp. NPDC014882 TaxID=3364927 RepID=UPI0036FE67B6